jgi:chromosome segregation ATPase
MSNETPPVPQQKSCLQRAIIFSIRLLFALVVGGAIGIGIYYGIQLMVGEYISLRQDYQDYERRIAVLEVRQDVIEDQAAERLGGFQDRLETIEIQRDTQKDSLAELESSLASHDEFRSYQATVVAGQQETITNMQDVILELQTEVNIIQDALTTVQDSLAGFQEDISALESNTADLALALDAQQDSFDESQAIIESTQETVDQLVLQADERMTAIENQMILMQAMELATRARLALVQGNTTLAQSDLEAASALLSALQEGLPEGQAAYVADIIAAIDETLKYLPGAPLTAADQLENVWQMLVAGLPEEVEADAEGQATPETGEEGSLEATPTPTPTPTPEP